MTAEKSNELGNFLTHTKLDRRAFTKGLLVLAGMGLTMETLASCGRRPERNTIEFTQHLKELLSVSEDSTRLSLAQFARTLPPGWMSNQHLGTFTNDKSQNVSVTLDSAGEPIYTVEGKQPIVDNLLFPVPSILEIQQETIGNNHYIIYGSVGTTGRLARNKNQLLEFTNHFFADSPAQTNVLHLDFRTPAPGFARQYVPIGEPSGEVLSTGEELFGENSVMVEHDYNDNSNVVQRFDVMANFHALETHSAQDGLARERVLTITFANEIFNALERVHPSVNLEPTVNESPSTIAGLLAGFDSEFAEKMLGGVLYGDAVALLAEEMEDLRAIGS